MRGMHAAYKSSPEKGKGESKRCLAGCDLRSRLVSLLLLGSFVCTWDTCPLPGRFGGWVFFFVYLRNKGIVRKRDNVRLTQCKTSDAKYWQRFPLLRIAWWRDFTYILD